ncbi:CDGSH iron-sulfur domain-containing protein [Dethiothermospora halolimnae]|uniref:CDGSH iron-sulfur domain-containing protein n=1 Tax=Dethiothermospora halolimnae TaxID=3114390 RepID=UPI003CCC4593
MGDSKIKVNDNGSLLVDKNIKLIDGEGNEIKTNGNYYLCRCGLSKNKPFCDGSHKGKFQDKVRAK